MDGELDKVSIGGPVNKVIDFLVNHLETRTQLQLMIGKDKPATYADPTTHVWLYSPGNATVQRLADDIIMLNEKLGSSQEYCSTDRVTREIIHRSMIDHGYGARLVSVLQQVLAQLKKPLNISADDWWTYDVCDKDLNAQARAVNKLLSSTTTADYTSVQQVISRAQKNPQYAARMAEIFTSLAFMSPVDRTEKSKPPAKGSQADLAG